MIDSHDYFTIERPKLYGKTTMLNHLTEMLKSEYLCLKISFKRQEEMFVSENAFSNEFLSLLQNSTDVILPRNEDNSINLSDCIKQICENIKVVLIVDNVDASPDNGAFQHFLSVLRAVHADRFNGSAFHSVILLSVRNIKNISDNKYDAPWNIAADFNVSMSFSLRTIFLRC
jgi:hypothetical protein